MLSEKAYASIAQMVERILGKDEVTGPTPVRSSIQTRSSERVFLSVAKVIVISNINNCFCLD